MKSFGRTHLHGLSDVTFLGESVKSRFTLRGVSRRLLERSLIVSLNEMLDWDSPQCKWLVVDG